MTINRARRGAGAFSLIELLCVLAIIGVLAALLLPALSQARARARRVQCVGHLRQAGIGFLNFAQDHNGQFPMSVPVSAGGTLEFARSAYGIAGEFYFSFRHFQVLSNELVTPKLVVCPADTREPAASFAALANQAVSYFVGISAVPASPDSILAGDRNLTNDWARPATLLHFGPNNALRWTSELHQFKGNLLFADGRVEEKNTPGLVGSGNPASIIADLAMPTVPTGSGKPASASAAKPRESGLPTASAPKEAGAPLVSQNLAAVPRRADLPPFPKTTAANSRPGWRPDVSSSQNQPDAPFLQAPLQPGAGLQAVDSNSVRESSETNDPGFSLFPPLLGQGGMLNSTGGHWLLLVLSLVLVVGSLLLVRRRLAKSPLLRKAYHEMFRVS